MPQSQPPSSRSTVSQAQLWNPARHALRVSADRLVRSWRYVNRAGIEVTIYVECGSARALSSANAVLATIAGAAF